MVTPKEAAERMRRLTESHSGEALHRAADALMCELMRAAGYDEAVAVFLRAVGAAHEETP